MLGNPLDFRNSRLPDFALVSTQLFFSYLASRFVKISPFRISSSISLKPAIFTEHKEITDRKAITDCKSSLVLPEKRGTMKSIILC